MRGGDGAHQLLEHVARARLDGQAWCREEKTQHGAAPPKSLDASNLRCEKLAWFEILGAHDTHALLAHSPSSLPVSGLATPRAVGAARARGDAVGGARARRAARGGA